MLSFVTMNYMYLASKSFEIYGQKIIKPVLFPASQFTYKRYVIKLNLIYKNSLNKSFYKI